MGVGVWVCAHIGTYSYSLNLVQSTIDCSFIQFFSFLEGNLSKNPTRRNSGVILDSFIIALINADK